MTSPTVISAVGPVSGVDLFGAGSVPATATLVRDRTTRWTAAQLLARVGSAALLLSQLDGHAGRAVPALLSSSPLALALALGGIHARRPLAPLSVRARPAELAAAVTGLGSAALLTAPQYAELAGQVAQLTGCDVLVVEDLPAVDPEVTPGHPSALNASQVAVVFHTSGTTGQPKPVAAPLGALQARVGVYRELLGLRPGDLYWTASPFHHVAGLSMQLMALGAGAGVLTAPWSRSGWPELARHAPTHCLLVPTMIDQLLEDGTLGQVRPRVLQYGSAPIHPDVLRGALTALPGTELVQMFGQTEGNPLTSMSGADHRAAVTRPELLSTAGVAAPGVELRIAEPDGGGAGEVWARGAHLFAPDADGWLHTGDLGVLSENGYLRLVGRLKDRIIRGGENIEPLEIESVLQSHPLVREAAVVGVPDRRWGQVVKAVVVPLLDHQPPTAASLRLLCAETLAGFKVPSLWEQRDALPRNPAGKVLRRELLTDGGTRLALPLTDHDAAAPRPSAPAGSRP